MAGAPFFISDALEKLIALVSIKKDVDVQWFGSPYLLSSVWLFLSFFDYGINNSQYCKHNTNPT